MSEHSGLGSPSAPPPPAALRSLALVPLGPPFPEPELLDWLGTALERRLRVRARVAGEEALRPSAGSGRASADEALDHLAALRPPVGDQPPTEWSLGVAAVDLHADDRPFVFGAAAQGGAWAIVGIARLLPDDPFLDRELLRERLLKEALHELGHLAGLPHCRTPGCVMSLAARLDDVDRRSADFCTDCDRRLTTLDPPLTAR